MRVWLLPVSAPDLHICSQRRFEPNNGSIIGRECCCSIGRKSIILGCGGLTEGGFSLSTLFSPSTIYILLLIFSPDHLYSREYSRILRIFSPRERSADAKNRSKVEVCAPKPLRNVQNLKISVCIDPKPTFEGAKELFREALVKTVLDAAIVTSRIFKNI